MVNADEWRFMVYDAFGKMVAEYGNDEPNITAGLKFVHQDWQGSVRTITNRNGYVIGRTDYQAFGDKIGGGIGDRNTAQGYLPDQSLRQGYGMTENDEGSGQQHTWFRKLETQAGRWTSPDPYNGSMSIRNPQSFNRFGYVNNDPVNYIDPTGLVSWVALWRCEYDPLFERSHCWIDGYIRYDNPAARTEILGGGSDGGGRGSISIDVRVDYNDPVYKNCVERAKSVYNERVAEAKKKYDRTDTTLTNQDYVSAVLGGAVGALAGRSPGAIISGTIAGIAITKAVKVVDKELTYALAKLDEQYTGALKSCYSNLRARTIAASRPN